MDQFNNFKKRLELLGLYCSVKDDTIFIKSDKSKKLFIYALKEYLKTECSIRFSTKNNDFIVVEDISYELKIRDRNISVLEIYLPKIDDFLDNPIKIEELGQKVVNELKIQEDKNKYRIDDAIAFFSDKKNLARQFIKIQPLFYDKSKNFWIWDREDTFWKIVDDVDILNLISRSSKADTISSKEKCEILEGLKQVGRMCHPKDMEKTWVQFKDNIYDYATGETFKASPKYFATNPIPWKIGDSDETPNIDKLFDEWVGVDNSIMLKEIASFCLIPDYPLHRIFCLLGEGRNGKSRYLAFIDKLVGRDNTCSVDLDNLIASRFESFALYKKLVCIMGETNFATVKRTAVLKSLSGQDLFSFESKGKDSIKDVNYAKLLIATNNLPETTDKTDGWYRRWITVDFPNQFPEGKDILATIPEEEYNNFCKKCLDIIKRLHEKGKFSKEGSVDDRRKRYEERSNPFDKFYQDNCVQDHEGHIFKHEFRNKFKDYCKDNRFREPTDTFIGTKMKDLDIDTKKIQAEWVNDSGSKPYIRAWMGISWKKNTLTKAFVESIKENDSIHKKIQEIDMNKIKEELI